jgi:hypothetical protein
VYTIKVCELITHVRRFEETAALIEDFGYIADLLGPRMGCFLFQLPPGVRYSSETLHSILSQLDLTRRNVVEFRHKSWWNEEVFKLSRQRGCAAPRPCGSISTSIATAIHQKRQAVIGIIGSFCGHRNIHYFCELLRQFTIP